MRGIITNQGTNNRNKIKSNQIKDKDRIERMATKQSEREGEEVDRGKRTGEKDSGRGSVCEG